MSYHGCFLFICMYLYLYFASLLKCIGTAIIHHTIITFSRSEKTVYSTHVQDNNSITAMLIMDE